MRITISATATISLPGTASLSLLGFNGGRGKDKERDLDDEKEKHKDEGKAAGRDKAEGKEKDTQRPYEVSLVLAIVIRRLEGNVLFKVNSPLFPATCSSGFISSMLRFFVYLLSHCRSNAPLLTGSGTPSRPRLIWKSQSSPS